MREKEIELEIRKKKKKEEELLLKQEKKNNENLVDPDNNINNLKEIKTVQVKFKYNKSI